MGRRRSGCSSITLVVILTLLCLVVLALGGFAYYLPQEASATFGQPASGLSFLQRMRYSYQLVRSAQDLNRPANPGGVEKPFEVHLGESVGSIATRLAEQGIIKDAEIFRIYLVYTGQDMTLQAGKYTLSPAMTPVEIAKYMQDATPKEVEFGILAGWRLEEIAAVLPTSGLSITPEEFLQVTHNLDLAPSLKGNIPAGGSLEGFLFPDTYTFPRDTSAPEMLLEIVGHFEQAVTPELRSGFEKQGLSLYQAVTLASIVQREAILPEEQPKIASVFYNRLAAGMKLDSDPTVQYALGYRDELKTWWTNPLTSIDLEVDSTYNTYLHPGLPPGPISNPGISALRAVAFPDQTPYYYFRAKCDGSRQHVFSETYDEHIQNACP